MSRAMIRWFVSMVFAKTGNQWCKWPAFCRSSLLYNMFGKRICIFAMKALGLSMNAVSPSALSC